MTLQTLFPPLVCPFKRMGFCNRVSSLHELLKMSVSLGHLLSDIGSD